MRLARTGATAALIAAALVLPASPAPAAEDDTTITTAGNVRVDPGTASPGSTVTVSTTACGKETYGKGESEAGGPFHLLPGDREGVLTGEFRLPEGVESGTDTVTLKCPPRTKLTATYRISGRPNGAVEAGLGGSAGKESEFGLGWLLVGAAVAGGALRMRRRAAGAGTRA
ncbi:sortase [Streptomyces sp. WAC08241]|uniref:sortase n=1 Tax=Streptomyces sp. WAC08241 TaxID=2487421 RepID=UPI000F782FF6|nr:sortase [Streptomyces sp. WAC08241]RSS42138.1 sortase [Streptomyces sp. WAC08241]